MENLTAQLKDSTFSILPVLQAASRSYASSPVSS